MSLLKHIGSNMKNYKICQKLNYASESEEKKSNVDLVTRIIHEKMKESGISLATSKDKKIDYVFSIGGDGTMLHSMHHNVNKNALIIGINAGNVGFLTPYNISDVENESIFSFLNKEYRIEKRSILQHKIGKKRGIAVNDYVIKPPDISGMVEYSIEIEHRGHVSRAGHYKADGILISGPCGSTAYNMNAGGAIVDPSVKCMQILMMAPTTLGARPLIIGKNSTIHIHFKNNVKILSDGILYHEVKSEEETLSISLLPKESNILVPDDWNFYSVLSKKLHWNNGRDV